MKEMKCPKCSSTRVERIEQDYDSPEAEELGMSMNAKIVAMSGRLNSSGDMPNSSMFHA